MPPRFAYWTIIAGGLPTAFRMAEREDLLPTFRRIQVKHPDAEMKYFARGRLWTSPEEARLAAEACAVVKRGTLPGGQERYAEARRGNHECVPERMRAAGPLRPPRRFHEAHTNTSDPWRRCRH